MTDEEINDILAGRQEGGRSYRAKPGSRLRTVQDSCTLLAYAVGLLAQALDEGPLRTKVIQLAQAAQKTATQATSADTKRAKGLQKNP